MERERELGKEQRKIERQRKRQEELESGNVENKREFVSDNNNRDYERRIGHFLDRPLDAFPQKTLTISDHTVKVPDTGDPELDEFCSLLRGWSNLYPYQKD